MNLAGYIRRYGKGCIIIENGHIGKIEKERKRKRERASERKREQKRARERTKEKKKQKSRTIYF